jgi:mannose-6-phosphate isomerase-like protein (cupin superfamily)
MPAFNKDIFALARQNGFFRQEILTNENSQVVLMSIQPGDEIGEEAHEVDQLLMFVDGTGEAVLNGKDRSQVGPNSLVVVPAGTLHNFINTGSVPLKLFTIYAPPEEEPGTVHKTKAEAVEAEQAKEK